MITIREAVSDDIPCLASLLKLLFSIEEDFTCNETLQARGLQKMIDNERGCLLVGETNGHIVGMCSGQLTVSTAEGAPALLVEDVIVSEQWRKKGLGNRLMDEISSWAKRMGASRLQLLADKKNEHALNFYKRLGWGKTQLICLRKNI